MCLKRFHEATVRSSQIDFGRTHFEVDENGNFIAYKVLERGNRSPFHDGGGFQWKTGLNVDPKRREYEAQDKVLDDVDIGFHLCGDLEVARYIRNKMQEDYPIFNLYSSSSPGYKVVKVLVAPEDVSREGIFSFSLTGGFVRWYTLSLVCRECITDLKEIN